LEEGGDGGNEDGEARQAQLKRALWIYELERGAASESAGAVGCPTERNLTKETR
jgi:hypothetical protein